MNIAKPRRFSFRLSAAARIALGALALAAGATGLVSHVMCPSLGPLNECGCEASRHGWFFEATPPFKRGLVIDCANSRLTDQDLAREFNRLYRLKPLNLILVRSPVSDAGLATISRLHSLQALDISGTNISDTALEELRSLSNLTKLAVDATMLTDRGCESIARVKSLWYLDVRGPGIDEGLIDRLVKLLSEKPTLRNIGLFDATISFAAKKKIEMQSRLFLASSVRVSEQ